MTLRAARVLAAGCRPAPELPPVIYPNDATLLNAEAFIGQAVAQEWPANEFYEEFGMPSVEDHDGSIILRYNCRDNSVELWVAPLKFQAGTIHWAPEAYPPRRRAVLCIVV
jgi:hypothetical protein